MRQSEKTLEGILNNTIKTRNGCMEWQGARSREGYGRIKYKGKLLSVPRLVFELSGKKLGQGQCACHKCDNPPCINPDHLFPGSQQENINDAIKKGRIQRVDYTERDRQMTSLYLSGWGLGDLAKKFKLSWRRILGIVRTKDVKEIKAKRRDEKVNAMLEMRREGLTFKEIGKHFGISGTRVQKYLEKKL